MTRHGKNCTAGAVYSYHERKKDTAASGYGTQRVRVGREALKDFDCCCLCLQPCRDPVVTPQGFLYEREAILSYLLQRKREIARQRQAYARQREEQRGGGKGEKGETPGGGSRDPESEKAPPPLPSFWVPSLTPQAGAERLRRPDGVVRCPMSGRRLRARDLVPVRFCEAEPGLSRGQLLGRAPGSRYLCAVTRDPLGNGTACAVLRPSGAVVTMDCVERLIRREMRDPVSGEPLGEGDIIPLQRGGTGFAAAGVSLEAKKSRPVMQA